MSVSYAPVLWNRQKKRYDLIMLALMLLYIIVFVGFYVVFHPHTSIETLLIRTTGTLALLMLHVILVIGPLARINRFFLPLLYNRRHLGVATFVMGAVHSVFNLIQFHALGNTDPVSSLFTANENYTSWVDFPFQVLGFLAFLILFVMAATSHDFWLKNLSPKVWKGLHMAVYVAYAMLILHVMLGVIQLEKSPVLIALLGMGMILIISVHVFSALKGKKHLFQPGDKDAEGFVAICKVDEISSDCAKVALVEGENIAIFKYDGKLSAVNNFCRHQGGPLGEGKIIDGCITCPWHGYQYLPQNGQSPPPFTEKVETYDLKLIDDVVWVHPKAHAPGTEVAPVIISQASSSHPQ